MDALIKLLRQDATLSPAALAAMLCRSESEIRAEISRLEAAGILLGYRAVVNEEKLGHDVVRAMIEVLAQRISKFNEVQGCYLMSGGYDLMVIVQGSNLQEVAAFVSEKLSTIRGVISTATHFRLKAYKENDVVLVRDQAPQRLVVSP